MAVRRRSTYVQPNSKNGGWDVIMEGHRRATAHTKTQEEAVEAARKVARNEGGGEVRVMNTYGKLVDADTVRGKFTARAPKAARSAISGGYAKLSSVRKQPRTTLRPSGRKTK